MQEKSQIFRYFISIAIKEAAIGRHGHPAKTKKKTPDWMSFGVLPGTRTLDPLIKSQLLYQLS